MEEGEKLLKEEKDPGTKVLSLSLEFDKDLAKNSDLKVVDNTQEDEFKMPDMFSDIENSASVKGDPNSKDKKSVGQSTKFSYYVRDQF